MLAVRKDWFRVEIASVPLAPDELNQLRALDVVLVDVPRKPETGVLVLSTGERFSVALSIEGDKWIAVVRERVAPIGTANSLAINLVFRAGDSRELPTPGTMVTLDVTGEPLVLSTKDAVIGHGHVVEIEGARGIRVSSPRRV